MILNTFYVAKQETKCCFCFATEVVSFFKLFKFYHVSFNFT